MNTLEKCWNVKQWLKHDKTHAILKSAAKPHDLTVFRVALYKSRVEKSVSKSSKVSPFYPNTLGLHGIFNTIL